MPVVIVIFSLATSIVLFKKNRSLSQEVIDQKANVEAYQNITAGINDHNKVLKLDISQLQYQNDVLLKQTDSVRALLKIKPQDVKTAVVTKQAIEYKKDTTIIINDSCEFDIELTPNEQTRISITVSNDTLSTDININNDLYLFIHNKREYKNKNKKFIKRLFTLDFKKVNTTEYKIVNSNELITVGDTRVIQI